MNFFDIIKAARGINMSKDASAKPSDRTLANYDKIAGRLLLGAEYQIDEVLRRAADTTRASTWYTRRASLLNYCRIGISELLAEQDRLQRQLRASSQELESSPEWLSLICELDFHVRLYNAIPEGSPIPPEKRTPPHSKKKDLRGLPSDWRERILARMVKYRLHFLTAIVTGCRPSEFCDGGVELLVENGRLIAQIYGKKVKSETPTRASQGQTWRMLSWDLPQTGFVDMLADAVREAGESLTVALADERATKNFSGAIRDAAKREWPNRKKSITAYCLRHLFSADAKSSGASSSEVAMAMGHASDRTCQHYGSAQQRGKSSVAPSSVEAATPVRNTNRRAPPWLDQRYEKR